MLVQAASGLERMMYANQNGPLKDSTVAQISAFVYYEAAVLSRLTTNPQFKALFTKTMFDQINTDFGNYIDALARSKPKSLHHVYEWKRAGNKTARLFKLNKISEDGLSFRVNYEFLPSRSMVPGPTSKRRHAATNQFTLAHSRFFSGNLVNSSIKNSGFQRIFNSSMSKALRVPSNIKKVQYSFSPNLIRSQADSALAASFGGVM